MTILSRLQEGGDLTTFEDHYGHASDSVNPVVTSAEFVLKVRVNAASSGKRCYDTIKLTECPSRSN